MKTTKNWFITGSSSGFGFELCQQLLDLGENVTATARKPESLDKLHPQREDQLLKLRLDVTDQESIHNSVQDSLNKFNAIDVLINNAGYGQMGVLEEITEQEIQTQFDTNVFGLIRVTKAVLPHMRKAKNGTIINISSIAGLASFAGVGIYCASKHAVEAITEALENELKPFGIKVFLIEPGAFRTRFHNTESVQTPEPKISDYKEIGNEIIQRMQDFDGHQEGDPKKAATAIIQYVQNPDSPLRLLLGDDAFDRANKKIEILKENFERNASITQSMSFDR